MKLPLMRSYLFFCILSVSFFQSNFSVATNSVAGDDSCRSGAEVLPINDQAVLQWKVSTNNQFLARAHVSGMITKIYPDRNGHTHFQIDLDKTPSDGLELVYNQSFGRLPALKVGMQVEACGDYITSIAQSGPYPPSPDGAILHWIHRNPKAHGHDSGFLKIDGILYGLGNGNGGG